MKFTVISYSLSGNNEAIAESIASKLSAKHIKVTESKRRTTGTIVFDVIFNRTPKVSLKLDKIENDNVVIFVGPIWMGQAATPLRAYFDHLKTQLNKYAFVSISGGATGPNPDLNGQFIKRIGKKPDTLINLYIADLMPPNPKPTIKMTSAYHINEQEVKTLTDKIIKTLQKTLIK